MPERGHGVESTTPNRLHDGLILAVLVMLAGIMVAPSLNDGLIRDDFFHRVVLTDEPLFGTAMPGEPAGVGGASTTLFSFLNGQRDARLADARDVGMIPWWTDPDLRINFWRPVAALTHWLDYQLWPDTPWLMHIHSCAWYLLLVGLCGVWFRQLGLSGWVLVIALGAYALDVSHFSAVSWLANRNSLVASCFGLLTLLCYSQACRESGKPQRRAWWLAMACYALCLLSAEAGLSIAAFLGAYWLVLDQRDWLARSKTLLPFVLITLAWRIIYTSLGYGAANSGTYLDPLGDSAAFLSNLLVHAPYLILDQLSGAVSFTLLLSPAALVERAVVVGGMLTMLVTVTWPLWWPHRIARFFLLAALVSMVPLGATTIAGGRLMIVTGIAWMGWLGCVLANALCLSNLSPLVAEPEKRQTRVMRGVYLLIGAGLLAAQALLNVSLWYGGVFNASKQSDVSLSAATNPLAHYNGQADTLILVNPPTAFDQVFPLARARWAGQSVPDVLRTLIPGVSEFEWQRLDAYTVKLTSATESFAISNKARYVDDKTYSMNHARQRLDHFFAGEHTAWQAGDQVILPGMTVSVLTVNDRGLPQQITVRFGDKLEDSRYQWLCWKEVEQQLSSCQPPT